MKFIDDKGKVFGKINIIDFLVILFLIGLAPVFYLGNKALSKKEVVKVYKEIPVRVKFSNVIPELADAFHEGDVLKDNDGNTAGVLKKVVSNAPPEVLTMNLLNVRNSEYFVSPNLESKDVVCLFELKCSEENGVLYFGACPVKIGSNVIVNTDNYNTQGMVIGFSRGNLTAGKEK